MTICSVLVICITQEFPMHSEIFVRNIYAITGCCIVLRVLISFFSMIFLAKFITFFLHFLFFFFVQCVCLVCCCLAIHIYSMCFKFDSRILLSRWGNLLSLLEISATNVWSNHFSDQSHSKVTEWKWLNCYLFTPFAI